MSMVQLITPGGFISVVTHTNLIKKGVCNVPTVKKYSRWLSVNVPEGSMDLVLIIWLWA
ncbi:MAG: hypothetical protein V8T82_11115 [Romboutsia timonensis]